MADNLDKQSLQGISTRRENSSYLTNHLQQDIPSSFSTDDSRGGETLAVSSASQLRVADSEFSLPDEFAASRKEYEFGDEDEVVESVSAKGEGKGRGMAQKSKETKGNEKNDMESYALRRFFLHAIVPVVLFGKDDTMTEIMLWTMAVPWVAYAAVTYMMQKSKP